MRQDDLQYRELLWVFCLALRNGRDVGVPEKIFRAIAKDMHAPFTDGEVREMILYLGGLEFCEVKTLPNDTLWALRTTRLTDLVKYNMDAPESIARPPQDWGLI